LSGALQPNAPARTLLLALLGIVVIGLLMTYLLRCPCERIPGSTLSGQAVGDVITDWSFANDVALCQIQVHGLVPWSINLNCMADVEGALYLSCSQCDGKYWSGRALANPQARLRVGNRVYPVRLDRLNDPNSLDHAWRTRAAKTGLGLDQSRPDHWWSFRVTTDQARAR
jgi:hypothetical protein